MSNQSRAQISGFTQNFTTSPAPVGYSMSAGISGYDGILLRPKGTSSWKAYPDNPPLLKGPLFVPMGAGVPLKSTAMSPPDDSMFIFSRNIASPACKGSFSTSQGIVCTTPFQRDYISMYRGSNKTQTGDNEY